MSSIPFGLSLSKALLSSLPFAEEARACPVLDTGVTVIHGGEKGPLNLTITTEMPQNATPCHKFRPFPGALRALCGESLPRSA